MGTFPENGLKTEMDNSATEGTMVALKAVDAETWTDLGMGAFERPPVNPGALRSPPLQEVLTDGELGTDSSKCWQ